VASHAPNSAAVAKKVGAAAFRGVASMRAMMAHGVARGNRTPAGAWRPR
jgi:hypothetical protein